MDKRRACLYDLNWQMLRLDLKGVPTDAKLDAVEEYYMEAPTPERAYRVYNYLDALVNRGGMEEGPERRDAVAMMENISADHNDFDRDQYFEWVWEDVISDMLKCPTMQLQRLQKDIKLRSSQSEEAAQFLTCISAVIHSRED